MKTSHTDIDRSFADNVVDQCMQHISGMNQAEQNEGIEQFLFEKIYLGNLTEPELVRAEQRSADLAQFFQASHGFVCTVDDNGPAIKCFERNRKLLQFLMEKEERSDEKAELDKIFTALSACAKSFNGQQISRRAAETFVHIHLTAMKWHADQMPPESV